MCRAPHPHTWIISHGVGTACGVVDTGEGEQRLQLHPGGTRESVRRRAKAPPHDQKGVYRGRETQEQKESRLAPPYLLSASGIPSASERPRRVCPRLPQLRGACLRIPTALQRGLEAGCSIGSRLDKSRVPSAPSFFGLSSCCQNGLRTPFFEAVRSDHLRLARHYACGVPDATAEGEWSPTPGSIALRTGSSPCVTDGDRHVQRSPPLDDPEARQPLRPSTPI